MMFETFLFSKILKPIDATLVDSFARLIPDNVSYNKSTFVSRHRSFSTFEYKDGNYELNEGLKPLFNRRRPFHTSHGGSELASIDPALLGSGQVQALLLELSKCFPIERDSYAVGVNQIRVKTDDEHMGSPAPGLHQDGYEYSCHLAVHRENVSGGTSIISRSKDPADIVLEHNLVSGEFVFFNDIELYHTATPVTYRIGGMPAWRDMLIFDFIRYHAA
jgi:hypothetical protein